ncbi:hypothetical protein PUN28_005599 [Cardiocondyla obscurior]|uniref:Uncharacterized protein n=1 Tax=Cardiocondyla obscurior TaxID=286306 RepID=A0AAW2GLA1_9HYME
MLGARGSTEGGARTQGEDRGGRDRGRGTSSPAVSATDPAASQRLGSLSDRKSDLIGRILSDRKKELDLMAELTLGRISSDRKNTLIGWQD